MEIELEGLAARLNDTKDLLARLQIGEMMIQIEELQARVKALEAFVAFHLIPKGMSLEVALAAIPERENSDGHD